MRNYLGCQVPLRVQLLLLLEHQMTIRNQTRCGQNTTEAKGNYKMSRRQIKHLHEYGFPQLEKLKTKRANIYTKYLKY